jgi:uncharacterized protein (DUF2267 family)
MFDQFRKRRFLKEISESTPRKMIDQMAIAAAVAQLTSEYIKTEKIRPISRDRQASVVDIWRGTRLEAISRFSILV